MSFAGRARDERVALAATDPEGEREARLPVPGSPAYWDNELARPLKGAIVMDEQTAQRIATLLERGLTALEQIALELGSQAMPRKPVASDWFAAGESIRPADHYQGAPQQLPAAHPGTPRAQWQGDATYGKPELQPPTCPVHGKPWRDGRFGWYCATRLPDGTWCQMKPQVGSLVQQQLP